MEIAAKALRSRVGQVLACLVGIDADREEESRRDTDFPAFGMWRDRDDLTDVDAHVRALRKGRVDAG